MKLSDYLKKKNETASAFARRLEISRSAVSHLISGHRTPSLHLALRIADATSGEVVAADWIARRDLVSR